MEVVEFVRVPSEKGVSKSVYSDHVRADNEGIRFRYIAQSPSRWAVLHENPCGVKYNECGLHHVREIGDDIVDLLVEVVTTAPQAGSRVGYSNRMSSR